MLHVTVHITTRTIFNFNKVHNLVATTLVSTVVGRFQKTQCEQGGTNSVEHEADNVLEPVKYCGFNFATGYVLRVAC